MNKPEPLTDRERQVLRLIAEDYSAKQIGDQLGISNKTVEAHKNNIKEKLGKRLGIAGLTKAAIKMGLVNF